LGAQCLPDSEIRLLSYRVPGRRVCSCGKLSHSLVNCSGDCRVPDNSAKSRAPSSAVFLDENCRFAHNITVGQIGAIDENLLRRSRGRMTPALDALVTATLWTATIFGLLGLAIFIVRKWRGGSADDRLDANELLTKFRDMHSRGGLSDAEYRTIKTKLATQIENALKDDNKTS
jgi:hypothetical protein